MAVLHNFIMLHDPNDLPYGESDDEQEIDNQAFEGTKGTGISRAEITRSNIRRDQIAQAMWKDYEKILRHRRR
jgi:hypothetical protein